MVGFVHHAHYHHHLGTAPGRSSCA